MPAKLGVLAAGTSSACGVAGVIPSRERFPVTQIAVSAPVSSSVTLPSGRSTADAEVDCSAASLPAPDHDHNQDQFLVAAIQPHLTVHATSLGRLERRVPLRSPPATVLAVADGVGGEADGHRASTAAIEAIAHALSYREAALKSARDELVTLPGLGESLECAFASANASIDDLAREGTVAPRLGTTLTVAYLQLPHLYIAHVGDSRCHLLRDGTLFQLTRDHTVAEQVRNITGQGIDEDSPLHNMLSRALGPGARSEHYPDVTRWQLALGDIVLVCSDGVTGVLDDADIVAILSAARDAQDAASSLVLAARSNGSIDDITAAVARIVVPAG
jgi:protein phosphatase